MSRNSGIPRQQLFLSCRDVVRWIFVDIIPIRVILNRMIEYIELLRYNDLNYFAQKNFRIDLTVSNPE